MVNNYLKIPLQSMFFETDSFSHPISEQENNPVLLFETHKDLIVAIRQNIDLLLLSQEGELTYDSTFGLEIWNHNFESKILRHDEKKEIETEIIHDLNEYESRLKKNCHKVEIKFKDEMKLIDGKKAQIHVLEIKINSVLNDDFKSKENKFFHKLKIPVKVYYKI